MSGWPFFRVGAFPALARPSRLVWRPPFLDVTTVGGAVVRVSPAAALLPDFAAWLRSATDDDLLGALWHFDSPGHRAEVPDELLRRIAERLPREAARISPSPHWPIQWASAV